MPFHAQRAICVFSATSIGLLILATHADAQPKTFGWGRNLSGQLGIGTNADTNSPAAVPNFAGAIKLSGGGDHTLALQPDGTVWATGSNISGQLGTGSKTNSNVFVQTSVTAPVAALSAGGAHSLALLKDGAVLAWGANITGQLGNGTTVESLKPSLVPNLSGVAAVAAGTLHSLAVRSDGTVLAWGGGSSGELGNGQTGYTASSLTPFVVPGIRGVTQVAAGAAHSLALKSDGTVWAWGWNYFGQLGTGSSAIFFGLAPTQVKDLTGVTAIGAGASFSMALKSDGSVWTWGANGSGQLGNGSFTQSSNVPVQVQGLTGVIQIAYGATHGVALTAAGKVSTWGNGTYGQLGSGSSASANVPAEVTGIAGAKTVAAGLHHSLSSDAIATVPDPSGGSGGGGNGGAAGIRSLIAAVSKLSFQEGVKNSLLAKLRNAEAGLVAGRSGEACGALGAFMNEVRAQAAKKIPEPDASIWIGLAGKIRAGLGCN